MIIDSCAKKVKMPPFSEIIRRKAYWTVDFLSGATTWKHYKQIKNILSGAADGKIQRQRHQNLDKLLQHAIGTTPFYRAFQDYTKLTDFPIIDKNTVLERYDAFKSELYGQKKLFKASSSGSTGIPFTILQDKTKRARNTGDVIYFKEQAGGAIGNKLVYIKLWDYTNVKKKWETFFQNIFVHNVMDTSNEDLKGLISTLEKDNSQKTILGYPSFFEELCNYLDVQEVKPNIPKVNCVISMAEALKQQERVRMGHYFKAPVFERYSNQENGILAQQTSQSSGKYLLNWASYHFEILELDSDRHVEPGSLGRIVVTDLFNYAMPLIRYDTGDMAIYEEEENQYPYFSKIYGRRMDTIYNTNGDMVSPFIFYMVLDFSKIKQFQFIQTKRREYLFKLNGNPEEVDEEDIISYFKEYLGKDAVIKFSYVQEIPLLSSGKRKKIVNQYTANL